MKVVEKFVSINGEGTRAGELAVFIRFKGCNLNCSYCDTQWANETDCAYEEMTPEQILEYALSTNIKNVTLTGGEPLLQPEINRLIRLLNEHDLRVEIETNGSVDILTFRDSNPTFTIDYKSPSSGCEEKMLLSNFKHITDRDTVKFVVGTLNDLDKAVEIINRYQLNSRCNVFFSPVFGRITPETIVGYMIEHNLNDIRLQIQLHKVIWDPNKRGV